MSLPKFTKPWNAEVGDAAGAGVLRLEAVVVVEAGLDRVAARDLRQADGDVLRPVDVQPARDSAGCGGAAPMRLPQAKTGGRLILVPSQNGGFTSSMTS